MAHETFVMSVRQAAELDHAFARNGWTAEEVKKLSAGNILVEVHGFLFGDASMAEHIIDLDAAPFVPDGSKVEAHQKGGQFAWDSAQVTFHLAREQQSGKYIVGTKLHDELKAKSVFNANLLDYLLKHPHLIPEEWKGKYLFFWGTIYRDRGGGRYVRCLSRDGAWWDWDCSWLDGVFDGACPAALRAS